MNDLAVIGFVIYRLTRMLMVQPFILEPDPCRLVNNQERSNEPETLVVVALNQ